jgi:hypothetical protein
MNNDKYIKLLLGKLSEKIIIYKKIIKYKKNIDSKHKKILLLSTNFLKNIIQNNIFDKNTLYIITRLIIKISNNIINLKKKSFVKQIVDTKPIPSILKNVKKQERGKPEAHKFYTSYTGYTPRYDNLHKVIVEKNIEILKQYSNKYYNFINNEFKINNNNFEIDKFDKFDKMSHKNIIPETSFRYDIYISFVPIIRNNSTESIDELNNNLITKNNIICSDDIKKAQEQPTENKLSFNIKINNNVKNDIKDEKIIIKTNI